MRNNLTSVPPCGCLIVVTPNQMSTHFCERHRAGNHEDALDNLYSVFVTEHDRNNWWAKQHRESVEEEVRHLQMRLETALPMRKAS